MNPGNESRAATVVPCFIAARLPSCASSSRAPWLDFGPVPASMREQAVRRLGTGALLVVGLSLAFSALTVLTLRERYLDAVERIFPGALARRLPPALGLGILVFALVVFWLTRRSSMDRQRLLDLGGAFQVFVAAAVGLLHHLHGWEGFWIFTGWSHVATSIILFAALVPATPGRALVVSLAAAAMDPLSLALTLWAGAPPPTGPVLAMLMMPTALAVGFAFLIAHVVHGLGRRLDHAEQMGSYRLTEKLGEGGMGEVWRAEHHTLARPAAIKLIRSETLGSVHAGASSAALQRFEREAQATARLCSPHTIRLYDFGQADGGAFFYVMELLDGIDLAGFVERFGAMPPERAVPVLRQVCHSLAEAHAMGLVHRDVKPANVYLCRYGLDCDHVKVLDFGLVKASSSAAADPDARITQQGQISGTPSFLAPEQAMDTAKVDARADLYALGCLAYWLLAGRTVFTGSALAQIVAHQKEPPEPLSKHAQVPAALEAVVSRCLEKRPEDRFASALELDAALARVPLGSSWSGEDARAWWDRHLPAGAGREGPADLATAPTVQRAAAAAS